jgi:hypothetical protein
MMMSLGGKRSMLTVSQSKLLEKALNNMCVTHEHLGGGRCATPGPLPQTVLHSNCDYNALTDNLGEG